MGARWLLLVALVTGVVLMHHAPMPHAADHSGTAASASRHVPGQGNTHHVCDCPEQAGATHGSDSAPLSVHAGLHLCLAILGAFAVAIALLCLGTIAVARVSSAGRRWWRAKVLLRPPAPVPRRLSVLCVLRL